MDVIFTDRADAGRKLAAKLANYAGRPGVMVLGIPRGGVEVAFEVARALDAPLDVFLSRKLGVPGQEELAFGAVAGGDVRVLDDGLIRELNISAEEIDRIAHNVKIELERREGLFRDGRPGLELAGKTVILVDDGIATGSSMRAAIQTLRRMRPARLILAVPVAPASTCRRLRSLVDELVCVHMPEHFYAIGQFYSDFSQVRDDQVIELLRRAAQLHKASRGNEPPETGGTSTAGRVVGEGSRDSVPASDAPEWIRE